MGRRPEISGVLTRSRGEFEDILERSDLIVELMGGIDPTRDYVLRALEAGRHVVTANKQLLSQHGEEVFDVARSGGVQLRFEGAVAGVVPAIRVMSETLAGAHIERVHGIGNARRTTSSARWRARVRATRRRLPTLSGWATRRPTRPRT